MLNIDEDFCQFFLYTQLIFVVKSFNSSNYINLTPTLQMAGQIRSIISKMKLLDRSL